VARPSNATIVSYTDPPGDGIRFQWLLDDYAARGARDAAVEVIKVLVSWPDAASFLSRVVGYTTWNGTASTLTRILPLESPLTSGLFCDDYQFVKMGAYEDRTDFNDPLNNNAPVQDWCIYALTFRRLKFDVFSDDVLNGFLGGNELRRYCAITKMPQPRNRITSGFQFEYLPFGMDSTVDDNWVTVPEERSFIPDWQYQFNVTFTQVPITAVPEAAILNCANTVNRDPFQIVFGGKTWQPGELLFKGLASPIELYYGADGAPYNDLDYLFVGQPGPSSVPGFPGGWNTYQTRNAAGEKVYSPLRLKNSRRPPYISSDFRTLFRPGA
jgi:hypothetical protein